MTINILVPVREAGRIIGKAGVTRMKMEKDTGAKLQFGDIKVRVSTKINKNDFELFNELCFMCVYALPGDVKMCTSKS